MYIRFLIVSIVTLFSIVYLDKQERVTEREKHFLHIVFLIIDVFLLWISHYMLKRIETKKEAVVQNEDKEEENGQRTFEKTVRVIKNRYPTD